MAITVAGTTSQVIDAGAGNVDINLPGSPAQNDIIVVLLVSDEAFPSSGINTSGYNSIHNTTSQSPGFQSRWKRMGATPDTVVNVAARSASKMVAIVRNYRGIDAATAEDNGQGTFATGSSGPPDCPSYTTVTDGAIVVALGGLDDDDAASGASGPSGYSNFLAVDTGQSSSTDGATAFIADKIITSAGAEDPGAFTGGNDAWRAATAGFRPAAGGDISLAADAGSYTTTGTNASLEIARLVSAAAGSYAITGSDAALERGFVVAAAAGSYTTSGTDAALSITAKVVAAGAGSYAVTGTDASLEIGRVVAAAAGSYAVSGTDGALSITAKALAAQSGAYSHTGTDAGLSITAKVLAAEAGSYAVTGTDATLVYETVGQVTLPADAGSYAVTGSDAALSVTARLLSAEAGSYAITGTDAALAVEAVEEPEPEPEPVVAGPGGGGPGGGRRARRLRKKFREEMSSRHLLLAEWDNSPLTGYALELKERFDRIVGRTEAAPVVAPELPKFDPAPLLAQLGRHRDEIARLEAVVAETQAAMEAATAQRQREIEEDDMRIIALLEMLEDG